MYCVGERFIKSASVCLPVSVYFSIPSMVLINNKVNFEDYQKEFPQTSTLPAFFSLLVGVGSAGVKIIADCLAQNRIILNQLNKRVIFDAIDMSNVLDVEAREVAAVDVVRDGLCVATSTCFLPGVPGAAGTAGHVDVAIGEAVELLQVGSSAFALENLDEDQVLAMLQGGVLDVFQRLEKGRGPALEISLLFCLVAASIA